MKEMRFDARITPTTGTPDQRISALERQLMAQNEEFRAVIKDLYKQLGKKE